MIFGWESVNKHCQVRRRIESLDHPYMDTGTHDERQLAGAGGGFYHGTVF